MSDKSKSVFSKFISEPEKTSPEPEIPKGPMAQPIVPSTNYHSPPIEKMIDWLINRWPGTTVNTENILQFGPSRLRNPKSARAAAETLEKHGWLTPLPTRRYIDRKWRIERGPNK
jgi:hypothetical protein